MESETISPVRVSHKKIQRLWREKRVTLGQVLYHPEAIGVAVDLREGDAQALPFDDASFDTVVCTLGLCGIPDDRAAVAECSVCSARGGKLLPLDHIGSDRRWLHLSQRLPEKITGRMMGDYQTRLPLPLVKQAGFLVKHTGRLKIGTVERVSATKPGQ